MSISLSKFSSLLLLILHVRSNDNCSAFERALSSEDYIKLRLKETREALLLVDDEADDEIWAAKWKRLWSRAAEQRPRAVDLFDETFMMMDESRGQVLLSLVEANDTARHKHRSSNLVSPDQPISFVKSHSQSDLSLLLLCQITRCTHYRAFNASSFQRGQTLDYPALLPTDAAFFTHDGKPHLVIAYDSDDYYSSDGLATADSKIYQWNGTEMVCIHQVPVLNPKSVVTFQHDQSTLLLFTVERKTGDATQNSPVIYQLNDNRSIRRLTPASATGTAVIASIYPYNYAEQRYLLTIDARGSLDILRWNGAAFETWANLPNVQPRADRMRILQIDNETSLLLASYAHELRVYRLEDTKATLLAELPVLNGQRVIDMTSWRRKDAEEMMLLLIKINAEGAYQSELWQLNLKQTDDVEDEYAEIKACLRDLKDALDWRARALERFQMDQSSRRDLFNSSNATSRTVHVGDLNINGGNISLVEFREQLNATVASPRRTKAKLLGLRRHVSALKDSMLRMEARLLGDVSVDGEIFVEELYVDGGGSLEASHINGGPADLENYLISGIDQQFSGPLKLNKVSVDELSVGELCGYSSDYWMRVDDSERNSIADLKNANGSSATVDNGTIVIESNLTMTEQLNARRINGIDVKDFLKDLFIIGQQQTIHGNARYEGIVQATRLYSKQVNNVSSSDLITRPSNQSLQDVFIDALEVEQLYVENINGVPIDGAARMSRENVIKGKLTLAKLLITDELAVEESVAIPLSHPTQVYDQIHIDGHLFLRNLELEEQASLKLTGTKPLQASLRQLVARSWSRSTDQLIQAPIVLQRGASIDRLDCLYLNGLAEQDFLYTDSVRLDGLDNVTFANFQFNRVVGQSSAGNQQQPLASFVEESNDHLTFRRAVRMRQLSVDRLFADKYNGITIDSIMQPASDLLELPDGFEFEAVRVDEMSVDELHAHRLNSRDVTAVLGGALRTDRDVSLDRLSLDKLHLASPNVSVAQVNDQDLERTFENLEELSSANGSRLELTIESGVAIEGDLRVDRINGEEAGNYVNRMRDAVDLSVYVDIGSLVNLTVVQDLEVGRLNGHRLDNDFFASALSKTEQQTLDGQVEFLEARMTYLTADAINGFDLHRLIYVDRPGVIYGNVSFAHLSLDGNVTSQTFNGQNASKVERKFRRLPTGNIENLVVQGDVKWDEPSSSLHSLAYLLDNAVTKHGDQLIASPITFEKPVSVESLYLPDERGASEISRKTSEIISDTVIDAGDVITVRGTKIFKRGLIAGNLHVDGNIDIGYVNGLDIQRVSSQIFQKDQSQLVTAPVTFLDEVEIGRLITTSKIHGVELRQLALVGRKMPKKLHFHHLHVDGNVSLDKLDGIDFEDFMKRRVSLNEDNEISVDAQFLHSVRVLNGTVVTSINQVTPEDLVQDSADGAPIMIHGRKTFQSGLVVEQNMETPVINDFQVDSIYDNAVLNGTNASILGSLVFDGEVEMSGNMTVSGEINGLTNKETYSAESSLSKEILLLRDSHDEIENETKIRATSVLYLEEDKTFNWHFAHVQNMKSSPALKSNKTRLEIVTAEVSELCGLPAISECSCRKQYIVDILPSGDYEIQEQITNNVSNSFYLPEGPYGLRIISRSASYSEQCSSDREEHSGIFWFEYDGYHEILRRTPALVIDGYVSDAQIFQVQDQLYMIVAIFYNKEAKTHATDSLLYQFDLTNGKPSLVQKIPTDGAKHLHIFQIPKVGMHLLIGCVKGRAESLLLRFNPIIRQFQMIRTFATGGSKYLASVSSNEQSFVILSNPDVQALQIFNYEDRSDTFVDYQNIFFESRVTSLGVFYSRDFGQSDAFLVTTTRSGWMYLYEYMFYGKFQQKLSIWIDDVQMSTPFRHMNENYLFAGFKFNSTVYKVIQQG